MNDFLEKIWWNNPVKNYLLVLGIVFFVLLLNRFISKKLTGLLFRLVRKIWKEVDKKSLANLLVQPLGTFLVLLVALVAFYKLNFPRYLETDIYGYSTRQIIHGIGEVILIFSFIFLLLRVIDFIAIILEIKANRAPDQTDNQLIVFFKDFFKVIIVIIGIMMVLKFAIGLNIGSLLTGLSIVGAAIALALRESLENLIASFIIFFDKPFATGDLVKVLNVTGTVEKIGLRSTRIRTEQKTFVTVPNKQMVDSVLDNLSLRTQRRADMRLEISLQTPSVKLESLISGIRKIVDRKEIENANTFMNDITGQAFIVQIEYYIAPVTIAEFNGIKQEVNLQTLKLLEELQIGIAGANTEIRIVSSPE
jgi:MscS family membrane protein